MKQLRLKITRAAAMVTLFLTCAAALCAQNLVILHTNDTHSHIDADKGVGGVLQRKALIDSVRNAEKNVVLVDAGDIVQGTLYFKLFGGEVEHALMDMMGYDIRIIGNHELDNGMESLARYFRREGAAKLSTNYDFTDTPLRGVFDPYVIKKIGGKKVGFMGLNIDPEGLVRPKNYEGLKYSDIITTANRTAAKLRSLGCDLVVAVTHIGYSDDSPNPKTTDVDLAKASKGIDIIISGHSHELVCPTSEGRPNLFENAEGKPVLIEQTGRYGANLGYIKIDLSRKPKVKEAKMIPVVGVDSAKFDRRIQQYLEKYRREVDVVNAHRIAVCGKGMLNTKHYATSVAFSNFTADVIYNYACNVADSLNMIPRVDFALVNCGGIRLPVEAGPVTEGQVLSIYPFQNYVQIVEMSGSLLTRVLTEAALQKGQAVSAGVRIGLNAEGTKVESILVNGRPIDSERIYRVATINYLVEGGDKLNEIKLSKNVWFDSKEMCAPMMEYVVNMGKAGIPLLPDQQPRIVHVQRF